MKLTTILSVETGQGSILPPTLGSSKVRTSSPLTNGHIRGKSSKSKPAADYGKANWNRFRLERFGKAMTGTDGWEAPGAVLHGGCFWTQTCSN